MDSSAAKHRTLRNNRLGGGSSDCSAHSFRALYVSDRRGRSSRPAFRDSGRRYKIYAFTLSGLIAGFGGVLAVARLGAAGPTLGQDLLLNSLAAIVVGGTSLSGGVGGPDRTLLGVLIITILDNGLNLLGVSSYPQLVIKGAVVIGAVLISQNRRRTLLVK